MKSCRRRVYKHRGHLAVNAPSPPVIVEAGDPPGELGLDPAPRMLWTNAANIRVQEIDSGMSVCTTTARARMSGTVPTSSPCSQSLQQHCTRARTFDLGVGPARGLRERHGVGAGHHAGHRGRKGPTERKHGAHMSSDHNRLCRSQGSSSAVASLLMAPLGVLHIAKYRLQN